MAKKVYTTVTDRNGKPVRIGGQLTPEGDMVMVHVVNGPRIGGFNISRFNQGLTSASLKALFA